MLKRIENLLVYILALGLLVATVYLSSGKEVDDEVEESKAGSEFVLGIDVSRYQGDIDFNKLYDQGIYFAFIKATEGRDHIDPNFKNNYENAFKTPMRVGAYHFYRFENTGKDQAENFIKYVPHIEEALPPVLDLEHYGQYINNPADKGQVVKEVRVFLDTLEEHYGKKPIIYCNYYIYKDYILGEFEDYDIWFRKIDNEEPRLYNDKIWTFWQFSDTGKLEGYGGDYASEYIDLNYFNGDLRSLREYGKD